MNELIEIKKANINDENVNAVDARELHEFLGSKQDYSTWIKSRIEQYGFVECVDFISFHKTVERERGAATRIEYYLTIDMAKELAMVERNDKGKEARQYFIHMEKIAKGEIKKIKTPQKSKQIIENDKIFRAYLRSAKAMGLKGNEAVLSAEYALKRTCDGQSMLEPLNKIHLISDNQEKYLTPTEIGNFLGGLSPIKINDLLESKGYQQSYRDTKNKKQWRITEKGHPYAVLLDTGKRNKTDGTPVQQIKWKESILSVI